MPASRISKFRSVRLSHNPTTRVKTTIFIITCRGIARLAFGPLFRCCYCLWRVHVACVRIFNLWSHTEALVRWFMDWRQQLRTLVLRPSNCYHAFPSFQIWKFLTWVAPTWARRRRPFKLEYAWFGIHTSDLHHRATHMLWVRNALFDWLHRRVRH